MQIKDIMCYIAHNRDFEYSDITKCILYYGT